MTITRTHTQTEAELLFKALCERVNPLKRMHLLEVESVNAQLGNMQNVLPERENFWTKNVSFNPQTLKLGIGLLEWVNPQDENAAACLNQYILKLGM